MKHIDKNHTEQISISTYDSDFSKKLKMTALFNYMQETTAKHCNGTTSGREFMLEHDIFWALARLKIEIKQVPALNDTITIKTWPQSHDKMFAYREYAVYKSEEDSMIIGSSDWILMDIKTRRPCRVAKIMEAGAQFPPDQESALKERPGKIVTAGELEKKIKRQVSYNDIDMYGHVNNVRYLEWGFDTFQVADMKEIHMKELQINFTAEARDGEDIAISRFRAAEDKYIIEGDNLSSGMKTFQMVIKTCTN